MVLNTRKKGRQLVVEIVRILDVRIESSDLVIEAKKHKRTSMAAWAQQSEKEGLGHNKTALAWQIQIPQTPHIYEVFNSGTGQEKGKELNLPARIDIDLLYFAELLQRAEEPRIKELDREMKWLLQKSVDANKAVMRKPE